MWFSSQSLPPKGHGSGRMGLDDSGVPSNHLPKRRILEKKNQISRKGDDENREGNQGCHQPVDTHTDSDSHGTESHPARMVASRMPRAQPQQQAVLVAE